jgi:hypothetical protein
MVARHSDPRSTGKALLSRRAVSRPWGCETQGCCSWGTLHRAFNRAGYTGMSAPASAQTVFRVLGRPMINRLTDFLTRLSGFRLRDADLVFDVPL